VVKLKRAREKRLWEEGQDECQQCQRCQQWCEWSGGSVTEAKGNEYSNGLGDHENGRGCKCKGVGTGVR
jgi:hypothetical protein